MTEIFHLSTKNHDEEIFSPRIPKTAALEEDKTVPRVCFAPSIRQCVMAINPAGDFCSEYIYFVHVPVNANNIRIPTTNEVPDVEETGEVWICDTVRMRCIGTVFVTYSMYGDFTTRFVAKS